MAQWAVLQVCPYMIYIHIYICIYIYRERQRVDYGAVGGASGLPLNHVLCSISYNETHVGNQFVKKRISSELNYSK